MSQHFDNLITSSCFNFAMMSFTLERPGGEMMDYMLVTLLPLGGVMILRWEIACEHCQTVCNLINKRETMNWERMTIDREALAGFIS